jgi:hypothetical protein
VTSYSQPAWDYSCVLLLANLNRLLAAALTNLNSLHLRLHSLLLLLLVQNVLLSWLGCACCLLLACGGLGR